jgi:tRNA(adenine34) deaminase
MRYELFMSAALAEARAASRRGETPGGAVAVLDEAMVASGQEEVISSGDPTAHAIIVTIREAARRLASPSLSGVTVFSAVEPCAMCVGALLESNVDGIVYSLPDPKSGAAGSVLQLADSEALARRLDVVSGILQSEASDIRELLGNGRPRVNGSASAAVTRPR